MTIADCSEHKWKPSVEVAGEQRSVGWCERVEYISIRQLDRREYAQGKSGGRRCVLHRKTERGGIIGVWFSAPSRC